ncbi:flagellar assembly protein FliH [Oceanococcus atlanticus]|uniref:Flagellar assembly protein FliH n=1 Tax=Oceanococcus atlanticus TaxID=1317117 RepID=A0A1Y1SG55_9GAMM|nr:FliH/SctL family protein [Oceanococcus atlanticus]ORE88636.1 flagellar assembly protein FliH [Oceanococcus atlanticus]RZO84189.1 MAG: hypothetical protein EVA65_11310 [Oceanococcus sp.]
MNPADDARVWHNIAGARAWDMPQFESDAQTVQDEQRPDAPPTAAELDALQKRAYDEAWAEGQAKGYAEGLAAGEQAIAEGVERLHVIAAALAAPLDELDRDLEYSLTNLALILARRIVGKSVFDDPQAMQSLVRETVAALGHEVESPVDVWVNPRDLNFLREHGLAEAHWTLHHDDALQSGDVRVKRGLAEVDGRLQQRLDRLAADMLNV